MREFDFRQTQVALGYLCDEKAVKPAHAAGKGTSITIELGGRNGPEGVVPYPGTFDVKELGDGLIRTTGSVSGNRDINLGPMALQANKNQSVDRAEGLFLRRGSPQNVYLLPRHPNFCLKRRPRPDQIDDHPNNEPDNISHHPTASPDSRSTASQIGFATGKGSPESPLCADSDQRPPRSEMTRRA
jgi:MlrC C-terminus